MAVQDHGCHGGLMDFAFDFIVQNGGLDTEKDYPYDALEETCQVAPLPGLWQLHKRDCAAFEPRCAACCTPVCATLSVCADLPSDSLYCIAAVFILIVSHCVAQVSKRNRHVVTIDGHEDVPPNDEVSLMKVTTCCMLLPTDYTILIAHTPGTEQLTHCMLMLLDSCACVSGQLSQCFPLTLSDFLHVCCIAGGRPPAGQRGHSGG